MRRDALALTFALIFPSVMTWVYFVALAGEGGGQNAAMAAAFTAGKILQFAFPAVYVALTERRRLWPTWPTWRGVAWGLGFGLVVAAGILALYYGVVKHRPEARDAPAKVYAKLVELQCDTVGAFVALACFISIGHALLEEYYWRWFVFGWLRRHLRTWAAVALANVGFMAHHVIVLAVYFPGVRPFFTLAVPFALGVGIGGAVWCWMYQRTGSLYASWISHVLIDGAVMVVGYDLVVDRLG